MSMVMAAAMVAAKEMAAVGEVKVRHGSAYHPGRPRQQDDWSELGQVGVSWVGWARLNATRHYDDFRRPGLRDRS
jgi:hypothetical protein